VLQNKARTNNIGNSSNNQSSHDVGSRYSFLLYYRKSDELRIVNNRGARDVKYSHTCQTFHEFRNQCNSSKTVKTVNFQAFRGRSLSQKLEIFKRVLRQSHQSFILLVKTWIEDTAGDDLGRLRQGKMVFCHYLRRRRLSKNESRQAP
jgi:hypothetical protein